MSSHCLMLQHPTTTTKQQSSMRLENVKCALFPSVAAVLVEVVLEVWWLTAVVFNVLPWQMKGFPGQVLWFCCNQVAKIDWQQHKIHVCHLWRLCLSSGKAFDSCQLHGGGAWQQHSRNIFKIKMCANDCARFRHLWRAFTHRCHFAGKLYWRTGFNSRSFSRF